MGLMDKIKNMFTEEEEVEEEPIKKEVIQVEIPSPMPKKTEKIVEQPKVEEEPKKIEKVEKPVKQEEKFIFPVYFDEKDFGDMDKKVKEERRIREEKKIEEKRFHEEKKSISKPISESYKGKITQEEKKIFKPTPIISPVYGVLDKNYTKEDITTRKHPEEPKKVDEVDLVRNKAYGTLEDEIVDSINYDDKKIVNNDMEEYHKKMNEVDFNEMLESSTLDDNLDELETKLTRSSKTTEVQPKYSRSARKKELEPTEINENELFNMIDTMYEEDK